MYRVLASNSTEHFDFNIRLILAPFTAKPLASSCLSLLDCIEIPLVILLVSIGLLKGFSMISMNISATLKAFSLLRNPSLCLPHATVPNFSRVPISIATALRAANGGQRPDIKAVVLDKDNCFAKPKKNSVHRPYKVRSLIFTGFPLCCLSRFWRQIYFKLRKKMIRYYSKIDRNIFNLFAKYFQELVY